MNYEELIKSIDIVDFISQYVELEQKGDEWWGLSPFKEERTPSFSVRRSNGSFYDFSSGIGGGVVTFVKKHYKCSFEEAIKILAQYVGISKNSLNTHERPSMLSVCRKYKDDLKSGKPIVGKKIPDVNFRKYERRWDKLSVWEEDGISRNSLVEFDVAYDEFSNRIVYPIKDMDGVVRNVGGRTIDPDWKAKKLRKYTYFYSWENGMSLIYGLFENKDAILAANEIIIFEGCKSVLLANTWGIRNTGALLTSHLSKAQMLILISLGVRVVFALDKDVSIRDDKNIISLKKYVSVEYIKDLCGLLNDKDSPVDKGYDVFQRLYSERMRVR